MKHVWVIGAGGLLGRAFSRWVRMDGDALFIPHDKLTWSDGARLQQQFERAVSAFAALVGGADTWEVYWAAGIGTLGSSADELVRENEALAAFLALLETCPALRGTTGAIGFASSAGAIYAGAPDEVITEDTAVAPTTPYAHAKLAQEALVRAFTERNGNIRSLAARITTLYGPGQALDKKQGLLTHVARCIVRNKPITIFVPFDTIRDYITATDAAKRMMMSLRRDPGNLCHLTQIVASERPITIGEIIATFRRVSRRKPRVVTSVSRQTALYTRRVQFQSLVTRGPADWPNTSLLVGIGQIMQAERAQFNLPAAR